MITWPPRNWSCPPHFDQFWGGGSSGFNHTSRTSRGDSKDLVGEQTEKPGDEMALENMISTQLFDFETKKDDGKWRNTFQMQRLRCSENVCFLNLKKTAALFRWSRGGVRWSSSFILKVFKSCVRSRNSRGPHVLSYSLEWPYVYRKPIRRYICSTCLGPAVERDLCLGKDLRNIISTKRSSKSAISSCIDTLMGENGMLRQLSSWGEKRERCQPLRSWNSIGLPGLSKILETFIFS